jgi:hypothetical protein
MVSRRVVWFLESTNVRCNAQCVFPRHTSTRDTFIMWQHHVVNFFDLEKEYDSAWRFDILRILRRWNVWGRLPLFISSILQDNYSPVRLCNVCSSRYVQETRVLQGSVLSVTLFAIIVSSVSKTISPSLYLDDTSVYCFFPKCGCNRTPSSDGCQYSVALGSVNGFSFSAAKTQCVHFTRLQAVQPPSDLFLNSSALPFPSAIWIRPANVISK